MIHKTTDGQKGLPRYFAQVFAMSSNMNNGRVDFHLPDGRVFRANGIKPGPVAELHVKNPDLFARLIREGDLGFCDAYLDDWWSTPDLQAFMDLVHMDNEDVYDGFPGMGLVRVMEKFASGYNAITKSKRAKISRIIMILGTSFMGSGSMTR